MDLPNGFPAPARRALDDLTGVTGAELLRLHGFGPKALRLLREELASRGLDLAGQ